MSELLSSHTTEPGRIVTRATQKNRTGSMRWPPGLVVFISLPGHILRFTVVTLVACFAVSDSAVGQWMGKQTGCYADSIAANPNRPTVSNPAHVTQYGVLELEDGFGVAMA